MHAFYGALEERATITFKNQRKKIELKLFNYSNEASENMNAGNSEGPYLEVQILHMIKAGIIRADATILDEEGDQYELSYFLDEVITVPEMKLKRIDVGFGHAVWVCVTWILAAIPAMIIAAFIIFMLWLIFWLLFLLLGISIAAPWDF